MKPKRKCKHEGNTGYCSILKYPCPYGVNDYVIRADECEDYKEAE